ncbi:MAG: hypothetical protein ABMB14_36605 [Myxococcota bacterium]
MIAVAAALVVFAASPASSSDCADPVPLDRWVAELDRAEAGFASVDAAGFADRLDEASIDLGCVASAVSPPLAARYHALIGLRQYVDGRLDDTRASFAAVRAADPGFALSTAIVPDGHEVHGLLAGAAPSTTGSPIPSPRDGEVVLDGRIATERPLDRPAILQWIDDDGAVELTRYLLPADPLPAYPIAAIASEVPPAEASAPGPSRDRRDRRHRAWVLGVSGLAAAGSGALYGLAAHDAARFGGPLPEDWGRAELVGLQRRTNGLVVASVALGGVAVGAGAGFAVGW